MTVNMKILVPMAPAALATLCCLTSCEFPTRCRTGQGDYAARYELLEGDPNTPCGSIPGDVLGLRTYNGNKNDERPDFDIIRAAIRPQTLGSALQYAQSRGIEPMEADPTSVGEFADSFPDSDEICEMPMLDSASLAVEAIPAAMDDPETPDVDESEEMPAQDEIDVTYEFSNMTTLVSAAAQGTQMAADLVYTDNVAGCSATYRVIGVFPAIPCESQEDCDAAGTLNSDFPVECNADMGYCTLTEEPPAWKE